MGERPVVELQFADFVSCAFDSIVSVAAKTHWRTGQRDPDRDPAARRGGGVRGGPYHSASPEGWFVGEPGLKVVCPGSVADAYGLLRVGDRRPRPRPLLRAQGAVPPAQGRRTRRRGPSRAARHARASRGAGADVTVVTYGSASARRSRPPASVDGGRRGRRPPHDLAARRGGRPRLDREDLARARAAGGGALEGRRRPRPLARRAAQAFELLDAPPAAPRAARQRPCRSRPSSRTAILPSAASTAAAIEDLLAY